MSDFYSSAYFKSILAQIYENEALANNKQPPFKPSLRHKRAMRKVFEEYRNDLAKAKKAKIQGVQAEISHTPNIRQRISIALVIVFIACTFCGWNHLFISENISGKIFREYTKMFSVNTENSPKTIEYNYALDYVPDGFEIFDESSSPFHVYTLYLNKSTMQTIVLDQTVKECFSSNYNTQHNSLEEVMVNGSVGVCIDFSEDDYEAVLIAWDNGDYIIEVHADLDKASTLDLCNIHKV